MPGTGSRPQRLLNKWRSLPGSDWLIVGAAVGLHLAWVLATGSGDILGKPEREQRLNIYTTVATVVALVGSFVTAAIAQYAAASGKRMREFRTAPHLGFQFRRNWVSILSATLLISGACLLAMILDVTEADSGGVHWMVEATLILGATRAYRLLWLFNAVIVAADRDLVESPRNPERLPM